MKAKNKKLFINGTISLAVAAASVFAIATSRPTKARTAEELKAEIKALEAQEQDALKQAEALKSKTQTLQSELEGIAKQRSAIETQIQISKAQYEKLQIEIKQTEQNIAENRKALGTIIADMSLEEEITPIERLAGSENISKALDNLEYQSSVKDSLVKKVNEIKQQKQKLEQQRDEVKVALANQEKSEAALQAKIQEQNKLIEATKGEEAAYTEYAAARSAEKAKLQKQQQELIQAAMARASGGVLAQNLGGSTAYPWNDSNCYVDANAWSYGGYDGNGTDGMGYGCRQCVSYVAWRLLAEKGVRAVNWGHANMWPDSARRAGFSTGSTPRAGSAGVISAGKYGHIVWVEAVEGDYVVISQYNYFNAGGSGWGHYSKMRVPASTYDTYIYF